jgi:hypothetical protein
VLSDDYFAVPDEEIRQLVSVLTVVGGKVVHADHEFDKFAPPLPPPAPDWSPVASYGGYYKPAHRQQSTALHATAQATGVSEQGSFWGMLGCTCWAV